MPTPAPAPEDDAFAPTVTFLRDRAMLYPDATEDFPWGHRAIKVKAKMFLVLAADGGVLHVTMKLPDSNSYALMQPYAQPTGYGLGKSGWVTCSFKPGDEIPTDLLEEWIEESYRAVAPKKLILALNARQAGVPEPPPLKPKRGPKPKKGRRS